MKEAVVLYPSPHVGHLVSMVELGKLLLTHRPALSIHILIAAAPYIAGRTDKYISTVSASVPSIKFHHLPIVTPASTTATHLEVLTLEVLQFSKPRVHEELINISKTCKIHGLIMDFFCTSGLSVANELHIPSYFFITSGACFLALYLHLPTLHQNTTKNFKDMKEHFLNVPGLLPVLATDMPKPFLSGTIRPINTSLIFPLKWACVPDNPTPPIYCIGPLILADDKRGGSSKTSPEDAHKCITWLDSQPNQSVVFLCFGSLGLFTKEQLREIAIGLEKSGQRFLWVVRDPPSHNLSVSIKANGYPDLDSLLPDGFLERTKERDYSVGGFVTHCGWNSTLEALCAGVPLVAWPLYAEQTLNRAVLVEEMKLALSMNESEDGFVSADEVEKNLRGLMESDEGKLIRERAIAMKNAAKAAMIEGGSSQVALSKLVESWN
ncbi:hypothetical protein BDE02_04G060600 [Populus trichocarpa]|nr:hypothetical protein BDE02_04G060600 [Populus trichocarpa]